MNQVVDASNMLVGVEVFRVGEDYPSERLTVWISGISTAGRIDDERFYPATAFGVVGTRQYQTVLGGTKTVYELKPLPR